MREPGPRLIGNVVIETDLGDGSRRAGRLREPRRPHPPRRGETPLGKVVSGWGNNGHDGHEGVLRGRLIGTYLHGPLLPKNVWLADRLIEWALSSQGGSPPELAELDDRLEEAAHESAVRGGVQPVVDPSSGPSRNVGQEMARRRGRQARTQGARVLVQYRGDRGRRMAVPEAAISGETFGKGH